MEEVNIIMGNSKIQWDGTPQLALRLIFVKILLLC